MQASSRIVAACHVAFRLPFAVSIASIVSCQQRLASQATALLAGGGLLASEAAAVKPAGKPRELFECHGVCQNEISVAAQLCANLCHSKQLLSISRAELSSQYRKPGEYLKAASWQNYVSPGRKRCGTDSCALFCRSFANINPRSREKGADEPLPVDSVALCSLVFRGND